MKTNSPIHFFKDGFNLANQSWELVLFSLVLTIIATPEWYIIDPSLYQKLWWITFPFILLTSAFALSLPIFLIRKQANHKVSIKELITQTLKSAKRIFLPSLLLAICGIAVMTIFAIGLFGILQPTPEQMTQFFENRLAWGSVLILTSAALSVFEFSAVYFSLEKIGLFGAFIKSVKTAFKNLPYIAAVALFIALMCSPVYFISQDLDLTKIILAAVNSYFSLVLAATTLNYYQKVLKKN